MPPLTSNNPFACLSVELIETDDTPEMIVVPPPKVNPPTLKHWEHRLPKKYVVSAILSVNSLDLKVEIETPKSGALSEVADVTLRYNGHSEQALFAVTQLGSQQMILGFTWLKEHNPEVNWQTKSIKMSRSLHWPPDSWYSW